MPTTKDKLASVFVIHNGCVAVMSQCFAMGDAAITLEAREELEAIVKALQALHLKLDPHLLTAQSVHPAEVMH
ncbi:MAG TPA: hypothetical protein VM532_12775 [Burkholderiales bacterium]|jgi:hypothetical protein|nr:hypothetical protein [Burkholderiales bacterium]